MFSRKYKAEFFTNYVYDVLETLRDDEKHRIMHRKRSPELSTRNHLISFMADVSKIFKFGITTLHLGVYILDIFMDNYVLSESDSHKKLIIIVILVLAAKSEDLEDHLPNLADILNIADVTDIIDLNLIKTHQHSKDPAEQELVKNEWKRFSKFYIKLEYLVFETVNFYLLCPTAASFVEYYVHHAVTESDLAANSEEFESFADFRLTASALVWEFLDYSLKNDDFCNIPPSALAASILAATRNELKIENSWTEEMVKLTGYRYREIIDVAITLIDMKICTLKAEDNSAVSLDYGYSSGMNLSSDESEGSGEYLSFESKRPRQEDFDDEELEELEPAKKIIRLD